MNKRYISIDLFKALGVIYIIITHQIIWMYIQGDDAGLVYLDAHFVFNYFRIGLHSLGFQLPLLAGVTFYLSTFAKNMSFGTVLIRAGMLCLLGFFMNLLAWGIDDIYDWDVLQLVAFSMVVTYPIIKYLPRFLMVAVLVALGITSLSLSNSFPFDAYSKQYWYKMIIGVADSEHYWAVCPWFSLFALGLIMGQMIKSESKLFWGLPLIGVPMLYLATSHSLYNPAVIYENIWGPALFKPHPYFVIGIMGFAATFIPFVEMIIRRFNNIRNIIEKSTFLYFGFGILWIYVLTIVIGYNLTALIIDKFPLTFHYSLVTLSMLILFNIVVGYFIGRHIYMQRQG